MLYILFILFTFTVLILFLYQIQYFLLFSPTYYKREKLGSEFEELIVETDDKILLEGIIYNPNFLSNNQKITIPTILFFAGRSHDSVALIQKLATAFPTTKIVTFNYRSYGQSKGNINEKNIFNDASQIASLVKKNYGNFYIVGFSIGSSVASYVASKHENLGVFLIGAFDSITLLAKKKYGLPLLFSHFFRYKFDNIKIVKLIDSNTYIFVSKDDTITYIQNARNLKKNIKNLTYYVEFKNVSHQELLWDDRVILKINSVLEETSS